MNDTAGRVNKLLLAALIAALLMLPGEAAFLRLYYQARLDDSRVEVLQWKADLCEGDEITDSDYTVITVPRELLGQLGGVLKAEDRAALQGGAHVHEDVIRNEFVRWRALFESPEDALPSDEGDRRDVKTHSQYRA